MKKMKIISVFICAIILLTGCDPFYGRRPWDYPFTIWTAEYPDLYFEFEVYKPYGEMNEPIYAQLIIDNVTTNLLVSFDAGAGIYFYDTSAYNQERRGMNFDGCLFWGDCDFGKDKLSVKITKNEKGFLDDSIQRLTFYRTDMSEEQIEGYLKATEAEVVKTDFEDTPDETTPQPAEIEPQEQQNEPEYIIIQGEKYAIDTTEDLYFNCYDNSLTEDEIKDLNKFINLKGLTLSFISEDLSVLSEIETLTTLSIRFTAGMNLSPLATLPNLKELIIQAGDMPLPDGLAVISEINSLEKLWIFADSIPDIRELKTLTNLKWMHIALSETEMSRSELEELRESLPNCEVYYVGEERY